MSSDDDDVLDLYMGGFYYARPAHVPDVADPVVYNESATWQQWKAVAKLCRRTGYNAGEEDASRLWQTTGFAFGHGKDRLFMARSGTWLVTAHNVEGVLIAALWGLHDTRYHSNGFSSNGFSVARMVVDERYRFGPYQPCDMKQELFQVLFNSTSHDASFYNVLLDAARTSPKFGVMLWRLFQKCQPTSTVKLLLTQEGVLAPELPFARTLSIGRDEVPQSPSRRIATALEVEEDSTHADKKQKLADDDMSSRAAVRLSLSVSDGRVLAAVARGVMTIHMKRQYHPQASRHTWSKVHQMCQTVDDACAAMTNALGLSRGGGNRCVVHGDATMYLNDTWLVTMVSADSEKPVAVMWGKRRACGKGLSFAIAHTVVDPVFCSDANMTSHDVEQQLFQILVDHTQHDACNYNRVYSVLEGRCARTIDMWRRVCRGAKYDCAANRVAVRGHSSVTLTRRETTTRCVKMPVTCMLSCQAHAPHVCRQSEGRDAPVFMCAIGKPTADIRRI